MIASVRTRRHRLLTRIVSQSFDFSTPLFAGLFVGMFFLLPAMPDAPHARPERFPMKVGLEPTSLNNVALVDRPYLVTLPSEVSFGARYLFMETDVVLPAMQYAQPAQLWSFDPIATDAYTGDREHGSFFEIDQVLPRVQLSSVVSPQGWRDARVTIRPTAALAGLALANAELLLEGMPRSALAWDAELWLGFDEEGRVKEVFLDRSSQIEEIDRELIRLSWNSDLWSGGRGEGKVRIYYEPGANHENSKS